MKRVITVVFLFFSVSLLWAQTDGNRMDDPNSLQKYASYDFNGQFSAFIETSGNNNIYLVDFSMLPNRFERVYFMNLSFGSGELINLDPTVTENRIRFMAYKGHEQQEVMKNLAALKDKALLVAASWSGDQKTSWLKENDKYK